MGGKEKIALKRATGLHRVAARRLKRFLWKHRKVLIELLMLLLRTFNKFYNN
jgi:hypothetical protein